MLVHLGQKKIILSEDAPSVANCNAFLAGDISRKLIHGEPIDTRCAVARAGDAFRPAVGGVRPARSRFDPCSPGERPYLPGCARPSPPERGQGDRGVVRGPLLGGRVVLSAGLRLAPGEQDAGPRSRLLGSLLLRGGVGVRRALRAPRQRFATQPRPLEEGLAGSVGYGRWGIDRIALRRGHPPHGKPLRRDGDLRAPLRTSDRRAGRPRLRPLPRLRL
jgi:hypothetical protein